MTADLAFASLREHRRLLRRGSLSARELAESCLRRIERIDGGLGAFEAVAAALRQADSAQAALMGADDTRPLLGVPVAVKADFDIAGQVTTHGSAANRRPAQRSAAAVRLLEAAGAVVIGTTRMAELARWPFTESARLGPPATRGIATCPPADRAGAAPRQSPLVLSQRRWEPTALARSASRRPAAASSGSSPTATASRRSRRQADGA